MGALAFRVGSGAVSPAIDRRTVERARKSGTTWLYADLADSIRTLGTEHLHTLTARKNLARALADAGRTREATRQYEILTAECLRVLGPDHRHTKTARQNLEALSG